MINAEGLELIKRFEGCNLTAYKCAAGVWTIGWGHTGTVNGKKICSGMKITKATAEKLLKADVSKFYDMTGIQSYVPLAPTLSENQRAALTSFAFNCGGNNLKSLCKGRTAAQIADSILLYNKAAGRPLQGLTDRRKAERALFLSGKVAGDTNVGHKAEQHGMDTLKKGDEGQQVRVLQWMLNTAAKAGLKRDGVFGMVTAAAVVKFQENNGLTPDGIVGAKTWATLLGG